MGRGQGTAVATPASGLLYGGLTRTRAIAAKPAVEIGPNEVFRETLTDTGLDPFIENLKGYCGGKYWLALGPLPTRWHWKSAKKADARQRDKSAEALETVQRHLGEALEVEVGDVHRVGLAVKRTIQEMDGLQSWDINANALEAAMRATEESGHELHSFAVIPRIGGHRFGAPDDERWGYLVGRSAGGEVLVQLQAKPVLDRNPAAATI